MKRLKIVQKRLRKLENFECHEDSKTRRKINHEFTRMDTNFLGADYLS